MDPRRKRLLFRCQHCGMKENDILLGRFAGRHMADLDDADVERLEAILEAGDNDLYDWITGKAPVPAAHDHALMTRLREFNDCL
ncbi:MAG: succinate dehydrogenase assembly factor 2 [Proteobacteria bacterium]|nr:succinate dehydrogenase assembly factor 2 [Pseudomonadota bacterium]